MTLRILLDHQIVVAVRRVCGELAIGLALTWWFLALLELSRVTFVSAYLNLNWLLVKAVLLWLIGLPPARSARRPYVSATSSAILVGAVSLTVAQGMVYAWALALLAAGTTFGLWVYLGSLASRQVTDQ